MIEHFILRETCDNVRVRVQTALFHSRFDPTIPLDGPLKGYNFQPNTTCATKSSFGYTPQFREGIQGCYGDYSGRYQSLLNAIIVVQKAWMIVDRALKEAFVLVSRIPYQPARAHWSCTQSLP